MINKYLNIDFAFIGSLVPDDSKFFTLAFSRGGQMCQENVLRGLNKAGLPPSMALSVFPIPSFPRSRVIWSSKGKVVSADGIKVNFIPFINVTPIKQITIGLSEVLGLLRWGWRVKRTKHRVVYTYNLTVPPGLFTLMGARLIGAKAVCMVYDIDVPGQTVPNNIYHRLDFLQHRLLLRLFDGIVAVSDAIVQDFAPGRPFIRVEGGIGQEVLDLTDDKYKSKKPDTVPFVIVSAGSLDKANGFEVLVEAFSILKGDRFRLRIAGRGPLECLIKEAARKDSRIEYCGFLPFKDVLALYNSADVLINLRLTRELNTKYFFPSKMMEYLASGVPVITTCTGHIEEEFSDFVFLLKDETASGLAELTRHVASLPPQVREDFGRKARAYMGAHKTWDAQGRKIAGFIQNLWN